MKSNQEIFDQVVTHLRKQGVVAMTDDTCMYRAEDGCMCAVGCLITDEAYDTALEGSPVADDYVRSCLYDSGVDTGDLSTLHLLLDLQLAHDVSIVQLMNKDITWAQHQEDVFIECANQYGLTIPDKAN